jgi:hypothetical protein
MRSHKKQFVSIFTHHAALKVNIEIGLVGRQLFTTSSFRHGGTIRHTMSRIGLSRSGVPLEIVYPMTMHACPISTATHQLLLNLGWLHAYQIGSLCVQSLKRNPSQTCWVIDEAPPELRAWHLLALSLARMQAVVEQIQNLSCCYPFGKKRSST